MLLHDQDFDDDKKSQRQPASLSRWWIALLAFIGFSALGFILVWIQSFNPLFGGKIDDPDAIVLMVAFGLVGAFGVLFGKKEKASATEPKAS